MLRNVNQISELLIFEKSTRFAVLGAWHSFQSGSAARIFQSSFFDQKDLLFFTKHSDRSRMLLPDAVANGILILTRETVNAIHLNFGMIWTNQKTINSYLSSKIGHFSSFEILKSNLKKFTEIQKRYTLKNAINSEPQKIIPSSPSVHQNSRRRKRMQFNFEVYRIFHAEFWNSRNEKTSGTWSFTVQEDRCLSLEDFASEKRNEENYCRIVTWVRDTLLSSLKPRIFKNLFSAKNEIKISPLPQKKQFYSPRLIVRTQSWHLKRDKLKESGAFSHLRRQNGVQTIHEGAVD